MKAQSPKPKAEMPKPNSDFLIAPLLLVLLLGSLGPGFAQSSGQPKRADYSDFRIITERNIFSPRRYARNGRPPSQPAARVDSFTLVGTMAYEKGPLAFFEGTSSDYRKVLKPEESIAGYKLTNIGFSAVKLANQTNQIELPVGMQMRREENGPWHLAAVSEAPGHAGGEPAAATSPRAAALPQQPAASAEPTASGQPASTPAAGGSADDVLKRLMQRREQEMNR